MDGEEDTFVERTIGEWTSYQDDEGRIYYHNESTGESSWDAPPGFEDDVGAGSDDGDRGDGNVDDGDTGGEEGGRDGDDGGVIPPYAQNPPFGEGSPSQGDGFTQSPSQSPSQSQSHYPGFTQSPSQDNGDDGFTQSPSGGDDGFTESPGMDDDGNDGITKSPGMEDDGITKSPGADGGEEEVADGQDLGGGWIAYQDDEGRTYYYNSETGVTQWDKPDDVGGKEGDDKDEYPATPAKDATPASIASPSTPAYAATPSTPAYPATPDSKDEQSTQKSTTDDKDKDKKQEESQTPAQIAAAFLLQPDAVMEPSVLDHISSLVSELGPQVAGPKAMQSLMNGYMGCTAMCGLMGLWLAELKSGNAGNSSTAEATASNTAGGKGKTDQSNQNTPLHNFNEGANAARKIAEEVVNKLAKERFTKDGGDAIMKLSKKQAAFVDEMIESETWRKLLIDLSATNKDSKLFMYCLQSISNLGHHRAIANRINQSDYFGVFHSMLASELAIAGKIGVDGYSDEVIESMDEDGNQGGEKGDGKGKGMSEKDIANGQMGRLVGDLRRTCTSTSYTYLYAMEVLNELIAQSQHIITTSSPIVPGVQRAMNKWQRLKEELEEEMLKPLATGTTFQRKRRIDVALTMSELFQRQRRRVGPESSSSFGDTKDVGNGHNGSIGNGSSGGTMSNSKSDLENNLDTALIGFLTKSSLGMQIDKEVAENMLKFAYGGSTDRIGDLLIQHPSAITALLKNMFGSHRIRQLELRMKCARLAALAVIAAERAAKQSSGQSELSVSDEDVLTQFILKGSQLCEQVENMASFTVLGSTQYTTASTGRQLTSLCIQHPIIAEGVLLWAKELATGSEFVSTAVYPTISPCILSLARIISLHHPLARMSVLELAFVFMGHSNSDISHQKTQSIKEQCVRLLLWLSTQGLSLSVISVLRTKLKKGGSSVMDSALLRYFMTGILDIVRPPLSIPFVRSLGSLLIERSCVDALHSQHFESGKREKIRQLIGSFELAFVARKKKIKAEDSFLLSSLKTAYST